MDLASIKVRMSLVSVEYSSNKGLCSLVDGFNNSVLGDVRRVFGECVSRKV